MLWGEMGNNGMEGLVLGVDVGGTKVAYGLFDHRRSLLETHRHPSDPTLSAQDFSLQILENSQTLLRGRPLEGMGLCLPSFVDSPHGYVRYTANLPNLREFAMGRFLADRLGVPVRLDNDCNAAALAEHRYGAGRGGDHMLYVAVSTGLGLGIILGGRLFRGDHGWAGESGHMIANPADWEEDLLDYEDHVAGGSLARRIAREKGGASALLLELCGGDPARVRAEHLLEAYGRGDAGAIRAVGHMGRYLGVWCYNLYLTFNIDRYVFGGGLTHFGDPLLGEARRVMGELLARRAGFENANVEFCTASLGQNFGIVGAAELLFD